MALLSMAIHDAGGESISFTGSQSGIITEDQHQGAAILEVRPQRIHEALADGRIVIVAGFQGVSRRREITTLGRGGSDTTAVALAAALVADACEIYSDVDGVYTADPNVCPQARLLPELRYETMQAMAMAGAKVLNAQAVEFARRASIAIHALKTGDASGRQTVIAEAGPGRERVVAVVGAGAVSWLRGEGGVLPELLARLGDLGATPMLAVETEMLELLVDRTGVPGKDAGAVARVGAALRLRCDAVGLVSLVGGSLSGRARLQARARDALSEAGVSTRAVFAAETTLAFVVAAERVDDAVRALHAGVVAS